MREKRGQVAVDVGDDGDRVVGEGVQGPAILFH
jgi:hypothetical protein